MKRGRFLILFILFSIVLFYTPKQDNPEITYLGCEGKPAPNATSDTSQGQNQDSTSSQDDSNINLVQDEKLINSGECGEDYEKKGEFIDNSGATFKHCVKSTDAFVQGDTYVTNSYLEVYDGITRCAKGGDGELWFLNKYGAQIYLCVEKTVPDDSSKVLLDSVITQPCPNGYTITSDIVEIQEGVVIMHCVARLGTTEVWDDSAGQHGCEITEAEDNGNFNNANLLSAEDCLSKQQGMKIQGELSSFEDVDIFKMDGQWLPGDVIVIESPNSILNMRVALFDEKGELLGLYFPGRVLDIIFSHRIFYQLRTRHESLYLALANHGSTNSQGEYSVKIKKSPGEEIVPSSQRVFLNFEGTTEKFMISKKVIDGVLKLEDSWLNSAYPERIEEIKRKIKDVVVENYRNFNVEVYTIEDGLPEEPYSTVYFGGDEKALLGYANSVDTYNQNHADKAIVFVESFELYHSSGLGTINEDKIARFIGNVASHELGHLLGLFHVSDCADIMDTTCSASAGMSDQEFKTSEIHSSSFKVGKQNSPNLLEYATGRSA